MLKGVIGYTLIIKKAWELIDRIVDIHSIIINKRRFWEVFLIKRIDQYKNRKMIDLAKN